MAFFLGAGLEVLFMCFDVFHLQATKHEFLIRVSQHEVGEDRVDVVVAFLSARASPLYCVFVDESTDDGGIGIAVVDLFGYGL